MTWTSFHRRGDVLREVIAAADRRRDGRLPSDVDGVPETFADDLDLLAALQLKWHTRLAGRIEREQMTQPMDLRAAVVRAWHRTAEELPGIRAILDAQRDHPADEATADAVRSFGIKPELVPSGEQSSEGLLADFPPFDDVLDPINRVLLPRADIATETLAAGLRELGWEIDDVTAYRTVRAAPPAAEIRDAIKSGGFQAVCFTSSSTVRNLVGIAGKPHASTVIAVIGPATAKTAEEHGLRVDVMAPKPDVDALVEALADFGAARRAEFLEAGQQVTKPSDRKAAARRRKAE